MRAKVVSPAMLIFSIGSIWTATLSGIIQTFERRAIGKAQADTCRGLSQGRPAAGGAPLGRRSTRRRRRGRLLRRSFLLRRWPRLGALARRRVLRFGLPQNRGALLLDRIPG